MNLNKARQWMLALKRYFAKIDDGGENMAIWAKKQNTENAQKIADILLKAQLMSVEIVLAHEKGEGSSIPEHVYTLAKRLIDDPSEGSLSV